MSSRWGRRKEDPFVPDARTPLLSDHRLVKKKLQPQRPAGLCREKQRHRRVLRGLIFNRLRALESVDRQAVTLQEHTRWEPRQCVGGTTGCRFPPFLPFVPPPGEPAWPGQDVSLCLQLPGVTSQ